MKIYLVENGNYKQGYYRLRESADAELKKLEALNEKYKEHPNLDKQPYFITEIETED